MTFGESQRRIYCAKRGVAMLRDFDGFFKGQACIVCGCGPSLARAEGLSKRWLIGVNDVARFVAPDMLVLLDRVNNMQAAGRADPVRATRCLLTFQYLPNEEDWLPAQHRIVEYDIWGENVVGQIGRGKTDWLDDPARLPHQDTTVFTAAVIAWRLGFTTIGIAGMDFGTGYAWSPGGVHKHVLWQHKLTILKAFKALAAEVEARNGTRIVNLVPNPPIDWGCSGRVEDIPEKPS